MFLDWLILVKGKYLIKGFSCLALVKAALLNCLLVNASSDQPKLGET